MEETRQKLKLVAGVMPSEPWLTACLAHLRQTNEDTEEAVLQQILHSDLRDVVREIETNEMNYQRENTPPLLLRSALQQSSVGERRKETLPADFALLVQVEELLDVSLNAEARYSLGPASSAAPKPVGDQRTRLLKIYGSDGHLPLAHVIAMETNPIPNLSVHSLAGIKILLRGPIDVRHGLLLLNPSNTKVLGGSVADLVVIQRKALEQARRLAGVGVDPTVKALCWSNGDDYLLASEEDEGESASEDVISPVDRQQLPTLPLHIPMAQAPRENGPFPLPTRASARINEIQSSTPATHSQAQNPPVHQSQECSSSNAPVLQEQVLNPYGRSHQIPVEPVTHSTNSLTLVAFHDDNNPSDEANENLCRNLPTFSALTTTNKLDITSTPSSQESSAGVRESISFEELTNLMHRVIKDRKLYEKHLSYVFVVPAKMRGRHIYFNIEKKKKRRKDDEKYEYVMKSHFAGSEKEQLITVLVEDSILRPHFRLAPGAMRQLSRDNRSACQKLVDEGGTSVITALNKLQLWDLRLCCSADEFFAQSVSALDQDQPILRVLKATH